MCVKTRLNEKRLLMFSALLASAFAIGGLVLGWWVGSIVIMFDGIYSAVSLLLTLLSLAVAKYIQGPAHRQFPFGKAVLEPVVIAIKASVILMIVAYALYSAIIAIINGGREVDTSIATLFGVVNVVGCGYAWWHIARKSKRDSSDLIEAEAKQWQMDTLLSVTVTCGFVVAWVVARSPLSSYAVYADPMMMVLMSFYFIKVPLDMLKQALRELLMMSPSEEICHQVDEKVSELDHEFHSDIELVAVTKIGRELWVNLDIHPNAKQISVADLERARQTLKEKLSNLPLDLHLTLHIAH
ncbi:cation diffusion facilitator family transporter [Vibrio ostreicida]|uniref:Cation diffusion facilitator family transporter n=1 Tax=Vibrio ostreicida TaxID=526588 RepID=A0ABT8BY96_9VIBR|nr:cation diffusion facilitator family transporter [Vibrio ostreicida]MDN3611369.1 cation diffusion facilitator family transporter [Vibrio ostreicida]NPD09305.1 cation diffusion facilitator family transporter [Vibrio ostreicida]